MQYEKVNMDNYRVTSQRGFRIFSPPNQTSPFGFIPWLHQSVPEMETLILASHAILDWSIVPVFLESEPFFLPIDMKFNFFGSDINVSICSA